MTIEQTKHFILNKLPEYLMVINLPLIGGMIIFNKVVFDSLLNRIMLGIFLILSGLAWFVKIQKIKRERNERWTNIADELDKPVGKFGQ